MVIPRYGGLNDRAGALRETNKGPALLKKLKVWALGSFNYSLKVKGASGPLKLPVIHNVGRAHLDDHDPHIAVLLQRLCRPETLLIDVGVNIGQTLVKYASLVGKSCRYIGFEPNIKAASYVDEIIIQNNLKNALIVPVGLGSETRLATLLMASAGSTDPGASINEAIRDSDFYGARKMIAVFNGDQVLSELEVASGPIILKIDVEGAELEVLIGLNKTINEIRPLIILEILPPSNFSQAVNDYRVSQADEIKHFMAERHYTEYAIGADGGLIRGKTSTSDYLFVPNEKSEQI
jgi:FkbM family methyltransferase